MPHGILKAHQTSVESGRSHNVHCEGNSSIAELRQTRMCNKVTYTSGSRAQQSNVQCRTLRTSSVVDAGSATDIRGQPRQ